MKRIIIFIFACCLGLSAGCTKFLDTVPDSRTEINTSDKFVSLVASSYPKANYAALLNTRVDFVSDVGSRSTTPTNSESFYWHDVDDTAADSPYGQWEKYYRSIASVNYALRAAGENDFEGIEPYIAEAKVIRAFSHFNLVNIFARFWEYGGANASPGIPYVTEPETTVIKQYDRGTVAKTYEMIEKDLKEGIAGLGPDNSYKVPAYHFTRNAANAFAARFYLYQGKWQEVVNHVNTFFPVPSKFINEKYGNLTDHEDNIIEENVLLSRNVDVTDLANVYVKANFQNLLRYYNKEEGNTTTYNNTTIRLEWSSSSNPSNLLICETLSQVGYGFAGWRYGMTQPDTQSTVEAPNVTTGTWRYRIYSYADLRYFVTKIHYVYDEDNVQWTFFTFLRQEEALLSRAEALAMLGRYDEAIDDMNLFCRSRAGARGTYLYDEVSHIVDKPRLIKFYGEDVSEDNHYMNKYDAFGLKNAPLLKKCLLQFIIDCRRNEFMSEGLRYWDMIRYRTPVTHYTADGASNTLYPGDDRWVIQMPETVTMSGLELNPRENLLSPEW